MNQKKSSDNTTTVKRSEKAGILNFSKDMLSALVMAFVAMNFVIQAFKIPTGSMEDSLLIGDFLLGLKFIYGAPVIPFSYTKLPAVADPKPGDVIIFEYPGTVNKKYIKRCVAGPGQVIEIKQKNVFVDGEKVILPPAGKYGRDGMLGNPHITNFAPLRIPAKGDTIQVKDLPVREFLFLKNLINQEHPRSMLLKFLVNTVYPKFGIQKPPLSPRANMKLQLYIDGEYSNNVPISFANFNFRPDVATLNQLNDAGLFDHIDDWTHLKAVIDLIARQVEEAFPGKSVEIHKTISLDDKPVHEYVVKNDNYFMIGDNRDNSADSRFWGYLNRNFVQAKAFILYFSLDMAEKDPSGNIVYKPNGTPENLPLYYLPAKIRWNRIGKLIRGWDGVE